jgi:SAM-dependent methyltransferase
MIDSSSIEDLETSLEHSVLGQYLIAQEQAVYDQRVADIFGFNALQIGWTSADFLNHSRMPNKIHLNTHAFHHAPHHHCVVGETEFLPFAEQSIDLVCMPHMLEICTQPQQSLREVARIMVAEGTLIMTGFRPWSLIGRRIAWGKSPLFASHHALFSQSRIKDWLGLLGFECMEYGTTAHALPMNDARSLKRLQCCDKIGPYLCGYAGSVYYIVAKKRVANMRLIKPDWKTQTLKQGLAIRNPQTKSQKQLKCRDGKTTMD